ncbi:MAG: hypothetical protein QGG01_12050, partial [Roseibacillus sp.]|nr:hypothetical protein [Roseibacillus sp.]
MGTPSAVVFADLVLADMEHRLSSQRALPQPIFYRRYIDDLFAIFPCREAADKFTSAFNQLQPTIQLDTPDIGQSVNFLDLTLTVYPDGSLQTKVFQKPMNRFLYLSPFSAHKRSTIANLITNERHRYRLYSSRDDDYRSSCLALFRRLVNRGHPYHQLLNLFEHPVPPRDTLLDRLRRPQETADAAPTPQGRSAPLVLVASCPNPQSRLPWRHILAPNADLLGTCPLPELLAADNLLIASKHPPNVGSLFSPKYYPNTRARRRSNENAAPLRPNGRPPTPLGIIQLLLYSLDITEPAVRSLLDAMTLSRVSNFEPEASVFRGPPPAAIDTTGRLT